MNIAAWLGIRKVRLVRPGLRFRAGGEFSVSGAVSPDARAGQESLSEKCDSGPRCSSSLFAEDLDGFDAGGAPGGEQRCGRGDDQDEREDGDVRGWVEG